jgi:hypothetical protein
VHAPPSCLLRQLNQTDQTASPQIGWVLDGFPVMGPRGPTGKRMRQCTQPGESMPCLDDCGAAHPLFIMTMIMMIIMIMTMITIVIIKIKIKIVSAILLLFSLTGFN